MSEYNKIYIDKESLTVAIEKSDLGESKSILMIKYPHKDSMWALDTYIESTAMNEKELKMNSLAEQYALLNSAHTDLQLDMDMKCIRISELQQQVADYEKALKEIYAGSGLIPIDGKVSREQEIAFKALDKYTE